MYRSRGRGGGRSGRGSNGSSATKVPLKGLFSDGVWKCNCDPRLPAQHFRTKNGGKNHGRWFYTCQHPQPKRCDFFLWDDEAKGREAAAVLNNSRTEPGGSSSAPVTPSKPVISTGLATPQTGSRYRGWDEGEVRMPYSKTLVKIDGNAATNGRHETQTTATTGDGSEEEFFDWPASDEEELGKAADDVAGGGSNNSSMLKGMLPPPPETPRKAAKTNALMTPGKRRYDDMDAPHTGRVYPTPATTTGLNGDDVFATPNASIKTRGGLFANRVTGADSPAETPTPLRYTDVSVSLGADSELASEISTTLAAHAVALPGDAREAIKGVCNRHVLYTRGIIKGRDVSRAMVKKKDEKIVEMQTEIAALKSERETNRAVIRHLRRDLAHWKELNG